MAPTVGSPAPDVIRRPGAAVALPSLRGRHVAGCRSPRIAARSLLGREPTWAESRSERSRPRTGTRSSRSASAPSQKAFIPEVEESLTETRDTPEGNPWYRAVYADDRPVGFVMLSWDVRPDPPRIVGPCFLWRLMIDERHQGRGYGREVVRVVADIARDHGASELLTSHAAGVGGPAPFYRRVGFVPTGEHDADGEVILALDLGR